MNARTGTVSKIGGRWVARVTWTDDVTGKRRDVRRRADSKTEACKLRDQMLRELEARDAVAGDRQTFEDLARYYTEHYLRPAEYVDGRKVSGLRSWYTPTKQLETLREAFGKKRLRAITYGDLRTFRAARLKSQPAGARSAVEKAQRVRASAIDAAAGTRDAAEKARHLATVAECEAAIAKQARRTLSITSVNRELSLLQRMFSIAVREGWMLRSPFSAGEPLVSKADELPRQRVITAEEERALLAACEAPARLHLRALIICALDTGMRQGEMLKLQWSDVDFAAGVISVQATNTKTQTARQVGLTDRLRRELKALRDAETRAPHAPVFGIRNNVKRSFETAKRIAGVAGLRFHDLRHTAATRLADAGLPMPLVGRLLGHTQPRTTYRYVNAHAETIERATAMLNAYGSAAEDAAADPVN